MGDIVPINDSADMQPNPEGDLMCSVVDWMVAVRAGAISRPITAILILEDSQGRVWQATDSLLARSDRARLVGLLDIAKAHRRGGTGNLLDQGK